MDDFIALLMAVTASAAAIVVLKVAALGVGLLAPDASGALGPTAQAIAGIGVGILIYRKAIRLGNQQPAL